MLCNPERVPLVPAHMTLKISHLANGKSTTWTMQHHVSYCILNSSSSAPGWIDVRGKPLNPDACAIVPDVQTVPSLTFHRYRGDPDDPQVT